MENQVLIERDQATEDKETLHPDKSEELGHHIYRRSILSSFKFAWEGMRYVFKNQRNIKIHIIAATLAIILSVVVGVSYLEMAILFLTILTFTRLPMILSPSFRVAIRRTSILMDV